MKKKWLIGLTAVLMSVTLCLGFASCKEKEEEKGLTDQEIANSAIEYVKTQYDVSTKLETPEDYEVVSEAPASDGKNYAVTYTVAAKDAGVTIGDYVAVGENKDGKTKISVTRGTVDVNYTLNASVKVNEATASAAIAKKVPATTTPSGGPQGGGEGGDDTQESLLYTLVATKKGENSDETQISNYTVSSPCTVDGITWDVVGNTSIGTGDYDISNWRLGGKSSNCDGVDRTITGRGAVSGTVKSVVITFAAASTSGITVNSVTLKVYSEDPGTGSPEPVATKSVTWSANGTCTVTADGEGWKDCYYQLVANLTVTASSGNKFISLDNIKFYGEGGNQGGAQGGGEGGQPAAHEHVFGSYTCDAATMKHSHTCSVENCTLPNGVETADCVPNNNVCPTCEHTYTETEILTFLFASKASSSMKGTYSLTGKVMRIDTAYDSGFENVTFTIKVGDKEVQCYQEKSTHSSTVKPGDTVTVQGALKHYYNGTKEFDAGCAITNLTTGELTDAEKVAEVKTWLKLPNADNNTIALPTVPTWANGVTISWQSEQNEVVKVESSQLTIVPQEEATSVKVTATIAHTNGNSDTKSFTVDVPEIAEEGQHTISLSFAATNRKSTAADQAVWEQNGITLTQTKGGTSNVGDYTNPIRIYQNHTIKIELTANVQRIKSIVFHVNAGSYIDPMVATLGTISGATVKSNSDAKTVTVRWNKETTVTSFTSAAFTAQVRLDSIDVTYIETPSAAAANTAPVAILPRKY